MDGLDNVEDRISKCGEKGQWKLSKLDERKKFYKTSVKCKIHIK